jgi:Spherulation-specific family 4
MRSSWIAIAILIGSCSISWISKDVLLQHNLSRSNVSNYLQQSRTNTLIQEVVMNRSSDRPKLQILLPLYIYPNWYAKDKYVWKQVTLAAKKVSIVVIINPNNGPNGAPPNLDYQQGIKDLHQAGIKIIGYVPSTYAKRDLQAVKADIDVYLKDFKLDGIFIDEAASTEDKFTYYQQLYRYIKSTTSSPNQVIINPGTDIAEIYFQQPVADVTVTFENYQKVWTNYRPPKYAKSYASHYFAALIHTTANRQLMKSTLDRVVKNNFGYIYITNDSIDTVDRNPWNSLPEYWQAQVNYIQKINTEK